MANMKPKLKSWIFRNDANILHVDKNGKPYVIKALTESEARIAAFRKWPGQGWINPDRKYRHVNDTSETVKANAKTRAKKIAGGQVPVTYWILAKDKKFLDSVVKDVRIAGGLEEC